MNSASLTKTCASRWQSESLAHADMRRGTRNRLIDPMIRRGKLQRHQVKLLRKTGRKQPAHIAEAFSSAIDSRFQRLHQSIVSRASCLVAMHPDQATVHVVVWTPSIYVLHAPNPNDVVPACVLGACIPAHVRVRLPLSPGSVCVHAHSCLRSRQTNQDAALAEERPFAVVPCCVFSQELGNPRLSSGEAVKCYTDLLAFIEEKDPRIRRAVLPFQGRNIALYFMPTTC